MKAKISWVTADYFADCDFIYNVMEKLCKTYSIRWIIVQGTHPRYRDDEYKIFDTIRDLEIVFVVNKYRQRDLRGILSYWKMFRMAKSFQPDVYYFNMAPSPFYPFISMFYNKDKSIYCAHDGAPQKDSVKNCMVHTLCFNQTYKYAKFVNMFSKSQSELYAANYRRGKIHLMHLALKNLGTPTIQKPSDMIRFLFVGYIVYQKNLELLIEAGNRLFERGHRNFRISINGACENWSFYQEKIRYPEVFECYPDFRPNSELPNLYQSSHYAVYPYRRVSQSGALKVAFNYNVPVIVPSIGSFKEEVVEGVNGYYFEVCNVESLVGLMEQLLQKDLSAYTRLVVRMKEYTRLHYSNEAMVRAYTELFNSVINHNKR